MIVLKFGGSSVANPQNLNRVLSVIKKEVLANDQVFIVLSALGGVTDNLLKAARLAMDQDERYTEVLETITRRHISMVKEMIPVQHQSQLLTRVKELCNEIEDICKGIFLVKELTAHTSDSVCSYGEVLSTTIFSKVLYFNDVENALCDSRQVIKTDSHFGNAVVDINLSATLIRKLIESHQEKCLVFPGFIGSDSTGRTTTLGRGGSDYTASIIGMAIKAKEVQIWTDVSGMMTANPALVKNAKIIPEISFEEALELSHFGAKVIYPKTITPAIVADIPILIKNTFSPEDKGTRIYRDHVNNGSPIRGISSITGISLLTLEGSGMIGIPGYSKKLFEALAEERINVRLITQSSSEYNICVAVEQTDGARAKTILDIAFGLEIQANKVNPVQLEEGLSIIALIGDKMKRKPGMSGKMFSALGRNNINVRAIAQGSSERNISAVIADGDVKKALNVLHEEFFENTFKQINLFICGTGNVGKKLIAQLQSQHTYLKKKMRLQTRIMGIANSRQMVFSETGLGEQWETELENGQAMDLNSFVEKIISENRRNSVFVDVTASEEVAKKYPAFLEKNMSVIACNKIACSSNGEYYRQLKETATLHNATFLFETNVGAGLPIIGTLNDLLKSGDEIIKIEAVLSGTLNFVFNHYDGKITFAEIVRRAAAEGFTEPDPRLDLSGIDVMRKILILARESGRQLELEDVKSIAFMPEECMKGSVDNFYKQMEKHEHHFLKLYQSASAKGKKLKYVARMEKGKASTGLLEIGPESDFYHLYGKDNVVLFYTKRYSEQPLVIKGAGAGADVTASGVFADILRAVR